MSASTPTVAVPQGWRASRSWVRRAVSCVTVLKGLIPLIILLVVWQLIGSDTSLSFPPPSTWIRALRELADAGELGPAIKTTLETFLVSLVIATVLGVALGMLIGWSRKVDRALTPTLDFFRSLPPPAIIPVAALVLGISFRMAITVVVLAIIWPILLNTASAMRDVPTVRLEMSRTLGLGRVERLLKVIVPSLLPAISVGVRISVSVALIATLLVEIIGSADGMGQLLAISQQSFEAAAVWGLLLVIGVFGFGINAAIAGLERRLLRNWPGGR